MALFNAHTRLSRRLILRDDDGIVKMMEEGDVVRAMP